MSRRSTAIGMIALSACVWAAGGCDAETLLRLLGAPAPTPGQTASPAASASPALQPTATPPPSPSATPSPTPEPAGDGESLDWEATAITIAPVPADAPLEIYLPAAEGPSHFPTSVKLAGRITWILRRSQGLRIQLEPTPPPDWVRHWTSSDTSVATVTEEPAGDGFRTVAVVRAGSRAGVAAITGTEGQAAASVDIKVRSGGAARVEVR